MSDGVFPSAYVKVYGQIISGYVRADKFTGITIVRKTGEIK